MKPSLFSPAWSETRRANKHLTNEKKYQKLKRQWLIRVTMDGKRVVKVINTEEQVLVRFVGQTQKTKNNERIRNCLYSRRMYLTLDNYVNMDEGGKNFKWDSKLIEFCVNNLEDVDTILLGRKTAEDLTCLATEITSRLKYLD